MQNSYCLLGLVSVNILCLDQFFKEVLTGSCFCEGEISSERYRYQWGVPKKEHHFADYLMHFEMIYSHFWQNQTTLGLSDVQNKFAPLSFYVCHTNILGFEAFLSSEIWFGLSYSITIAAFCMPNILVYQDQESVHK